MLMGILFLFRKITTKNCYWDNMDGEYLYNYENFDQNYEKWGGIDNLNRNVFYLLKETRIFEYQKFSRGSTASNIDFKRDFHFYLRDISKYVLTWDSLFFLSCNTNYGIAVILGPYTFLDYSDKTAENLLFSGLTKSVVIAFRANYNEIAIYNCKEKECDINDASKRRPYSFSKELNLNMHIV